jgi:ketosteroid isomerase-like protein
MTDTRQQSLDIVRRFFEAKERKDLEAVASLFADDAVYVFPLAANGEPNPWFVFDGKDAVIGYQREVLRRFSRIHMTDLEQTASPEGDRVFVTSRGAYVQEKDNQSYTNVYVFRFAITDGKTTRVDEYANPVTFSKLAGIPIG